MREAKKVESYPNYDAAYLAKRLGAGNPKALEHNRYKSTGQFNSTEKELVYLQNATKGYEAEAEECLKKEFKDWLAGVHEDNYYPKPYDNTKGGAIRRDMHGEKLDDWVPTWWGPHQLTYLPGVREYLREQAVKADQNSLDMNKLAHLGPQNVEEAWAYFKHWVKGRPVGPEECLHPSPAAAGDHTRPFRAGARHMQHETQYNAENPYTGVSFPRTPMAAASQVAAQAAQVLLGNLPLPVGLQAPLVPVVAAIAPAPPVIAPAIAPANLAQVIAPAIAPAQQAPNLAQVIAAVAAQLAPAAVIDAQQQASGAYTQEQQTRMAANAATARATADSAKAAAAASRAQAAAAVAAAAARAQAPMSPVPMSPAFLAQSPALLSPRASGSQSSYDMAAARMAALDWHTPEDTPRMGSSLDLRNMPDDIPTFGLDLRRVSFSADTQDFTRGDSDDEYRLSRVDNLYNPRNVSLDEDDQVYFGVPQGGSSSSEPLRRQTLSVASYQAPQASTPPARAQDPLRNVTPSPMAPLTGPPPHQRPSRRPSLPGVPNFGDPTTLFGWLNRG